MKKNVDTTPLPKPLNDETYIDADGVERWTENGIKVSGDNAFRLGFGDAFSYFDLVESAKSSQRASAVVEGRRLQGHSEGTIPGISQGATERLQQINRAPSHWAVR